MQLEQKIMYYLLLNVKFQNFKIVCEKESQTQNLFTIVTVQNTAQADNDTISQSKIYHKQ